MSSRRLAGYAVCIVLLLSMAPAASGWTLQSWLQEPAGTELPPGTPVTVTYSLHFDSWMTGSTFENDNTLIMVTDLDDPYWVVTRVEPMEEQPSIVEQVPVRQSMQVRLDGWTLSYSSKRFDVEVQLTGTTPAQDQSGTISLVKLQELDANADPVAGTLIKKEVVVFVPTPEPTPEPAEVTINMTPSEYIEITPVPKGTAAESVPTTRVTYSPGPEPLAIAGVLAGLLGVVALSRRKE